jgi:hypothetical protein
MYSLLPPFPNVDGVELEQSSHNPGGNGAGASVYYDSEFTPSHELRPMENSVADYNKDNSRDPEDYLAKVRMDLPMTIMVLFMNLGACQYKKDCVGQWILPIHLNQPRVNNRTVKCTDVYNDSFEQKGLGVRQDDEWGTLETAVGKGPHNMHATKAVVFFMKLLLDETTGSILVALPQASLPLGQTLSY